MHRSAILRVVFICAVTVAVGSLALAAPKKRQTSPDSTPAPADTPAAEPAAAKSGSASIRLWKEEFASKTPVRLVLKAKDNEANELRLEPPAAGSYFTDYAVCASGEGTIEFPSDDPAAEAIPPVPVNLAPDTFSTLVLRERDGKPVLEVIDDTPVISDPGSAELTVRNFAPSLVEIRVQAADQLTVRMRAAAGFLNVNGLDRKRCQLDTITVDAAGKESRWSTEVDFSASHKATLLILADPYGRIRPRVALDARLAPAHR